MFKDLFLSIVNLETEKGELFNQLQLLKKDSSKREPVVTELSVRKSIYAKVWCI